MNLEKKNKLAALVKRLGENVDSVVIDGAIQELQALKAQIPDTSPIYNELRSLEARFSDFSRLFNTTTEKLRAESEKKLKETSTLFQESIAAIPDTFKNLMDEIEALKQRINHRGGGGANRQISINSSVIGRPYNDFNFIGSIVGVPNNTTKQTDIYFSGGSGGGSSGADQFLASVVGVNLTATSVIGIYTVPTGKIAIITGAIIRPTAASVVSTPAQVGFGIAAGEDDVFSQTTLTGLSSVGAVFQFKAIGVNAVGNAGNVIRLGIDVAAT